MTERHAFASFPVANRLVRGLTIRARLALWYGLVVLVVLGAAGLSILWLQSRLGLARVDQALDAAIVTVTGVVRNELDEGLDLDRAVHDMFAELTLSGEGVAVVGPDGVVGSKPDRQPALAVNTITTVPRLPVTVVAGPARARIRSSDAVHRGQTFRVVVWASLAPLRAEQATLERALLLGAPLAATLAIIAGLSISKRALGPLADMARQTTAIDSDHANARLTTFNPYDELGTLGRAFNALLDRVAASLNQQRTFMTDASHQLRTPVSVVRTTAQVMLTRHSRTEREYRDALEVIARQAERLTRMVDDMFMLTLADADARPLQPSSFYLDELVGEVADDIRSLASANGILLSAEVAGETPFVGDEHLLRQMLSNLLENAIRHTPKGGLVTVSLVHEHRGVRIVVSDTGTGISQPDAERIFDRFVRLTGHSADAGGGLGLPIARWIAEAHGGTLVLGTSGPLGSQFEVTLPDPSGPTL